VRHRDAILPKDGERNHNDSNNNDDQQNLHGDGGKKLTRRLTVLYYLNDGWRSEHGGQVEFFWNLQVIQLFFLIICCS
jgi:Rps23 Pro-64 3,4-dihydroxylase Tpa1-like proline 4-hydroxylase